MSTGVSVRSAKKLGFFAALTMLLGSVVGIGIFFKNHSVLRANDWSGTGVLVSWIVGGLICLCAALAFAEVGTMKTRKVFGISGWAERIMGKKFGYFHRFNYSFFYHGLLTAALAYFCSESIVNMFVIGLGVKQPDVWVHFILGFVILIGIATLNFYSVRTAGWLQVVTTVLKFIPLLFVGLAGLALATTNLNPPTDEIAALKATNFGINAFNNGKAFDFSNMLSALPGILFAFDSFLGVGSFTNKIENGEKKVPLIVVLGMGIVMVLYTFIAVSSILHGSGMVTGSAFGVPPEGVQVFDASKTPPEYLGLTGGFGIFDQIFTGETSRALGIFVNVFICVSAIGVTNGITTGMTATFDQAIETETMFGSRYLKKRFNVFAPLALVFIVLTFWMLLLGIPAMVMNSDAIIDGMSNFPTLFSFAMMVPMLLVYVKRRKEFTDVKRFHNALLFTVVTFAVIGMTIAVGYQLIYAFFLKGIIESASNYQTFSKTNWGLFAQGTVEMRSTDAIATFLPMLALFMGAPYLNKWLVRKFENRDVLEYDRSEPATAGATQKTSEAVSVSTGMKPKK